MAKFFNVNGACRPNKHYMVDIGQKLEGISSDRGSSVTLLPLLLYRMSRSIDIQISSDPADFINFMQFLS